MQKSKPIKSYETNPHENDHKLWSKFKSGDTASFEIIYNRYLNNLYDFGLKFTPDISMVEDVIQEMFIDLWNSRKNLGDVKYIQFYLIKSFRRRIIKQLKNERKIIKEDEYLIDSFQFSSSHLDQLIKKQEDENLKTQINKVLQNLSKRQREIIYLRFYQNLSYTEISNILDIDLKYAQNTASKAFKVIKQLVTSDLSVISIILALFS